MGEILTSKIKLYSCWLSHSLYQPTYRKRCPFLFNGHVAILIEKSTRSKYFRFIPDFRVMMYCP